MQPVPYLMTDNSLTVFVNGKPYSIDHSHPNNTRIREAILARQWEALTWLVDIPRSIVIRSQGALELRDDGIYWRGEQLHGVAIDRTLRMMDEGYDISPMLNFLEKVQQNPIESARRELFEWLEMSDMPLHADGDFLAYKMVRDDYLDLHSGTVDNSIGKVVEMPREHVDPDRNRTCSVGLHFCSINYLSAAYNLGYGQKKRCLILKINPADVVAIPNDYSFSKGRTWRYLVFAEYEERYDAGSPEPAFPRAVFDPEELKRESLPRWKVPVFIAYENGRTTKEELIIRAEDAEEAFEEVYYDMMDGDYTFILKYFPHLNTSVIKQVWLDDELVEEYEPDAVEWRVPVNLFNYDSKLIASKLVTVKAVSARRAFNKVVDSIETDEYEFVEEHFPHESDWYDCTVGDFEGVTEVQPQPEVATKQPWWKKLLNL